MDTDYKKFIGNFIELSPVFDKWYLDTCVWGEIVSSEEKTNNFISFFKTNDLVAGLSQFTLLELTRADYLIAALDKLLFELRHNVWIPIFYDEFFELELSSYPQKPTIRLLPISSITGEDGAHFNKILSRLSSDPGVIAARNEHLLFGDENFMALEELKKNFPPSQNGNYVPEQAYDFSTLNGISYFLRYEAHFLKKINFPSNKFMPEGIPSLFARSLFLFFKFYIHGKSPNKSDFFDFAFVSYFPYFEVFVTEKDVSNVLKHLQSTTGFLKTTKVIYLTDFFENIIG